jgi:hypothetical protein
VLPQPILLCRRRCRAAIAASALPPPPPLSCRFATLLLSAAELPLPPPTLRLRYCRCPCATDNAAMLPAIAALLLLLCRRCHRAFATNTALLPPCCFCCSDNAAALIPVAASLPLIEQAPICGFYFHSCFDLKYMGCKLRKD